MSDNTNSRKKILLVDDDEIHLSITEVSLTEAPLNDEFEIFTVKSGKEALEFLSTGQTLPDIILLDILMPSMDGWVVFDKIHDIAALKLTPIMFYTSLNEESAMEKAYEIGAFDYIIKPCEQSVLLSKIRDTLQKAESQKRQYGL